jgi:CHAT domain-containing protein
MTARATWQAAGLRLALAAFGLAAALAAAATPGPAAGDLLADQACTAHPEADPIGTSLADSTERLRIAQPQGQPVALEIACRAWRQVRRDSAGDAVLQLDWQGNVGASLLWLRRSAEAQPLFEAVFAGLQAAGPAQGARAGTVAGMLALIHHQRGQPEPALQWSQQAVDALAGASVGVTASDRLRVRINHGTLLSSQRRFDAAQNTFSTLLAEAQAQPDALGAEAAAALGGLAMVARRQSRFDEALAITEREIAWRQAHVPQDPVNLVNALQNRGTLLTLLARHDQAEPALQAALAQAQRAEAAGGVDLFGHQAALRESLSGLMLARGRPDDARQMAAEAVQRMAASPEGRSPRGARPLRRLAEAELALGLLADGMASYQQALALLAGGRTGAADADTLQAVRLGHARALLELGDLDEAAAALQQVAADARPLAPAERALHQALMAALAQRRGDSAGALAAWAAADAALADSLSAQHPQRRLLAAQRCELQASLCAGLASAANNNADASADAPEAEALVQLSLARRARADGDAARANAAARQTLTAALASGQPRLLWPAYALLADLQADAGQPAAAIFFGKLALASVQQQRERLLPMGAVADARYLADKAPLYRRVAEWLLQAQRLPEALDVMRLLKQHEQAQYQQRGAPAGADARADSPGGVGLSPAEQAALRQLDGAATSADNADLQRLAALAAAQRITPDERQQLARLQQAEAARAAERLARLDGALALLQRQPAAPPRGAPAMAASNRPAAGSLHVHLLAGEQQLSLLLTGPRGSRLHQLPLPAASLALQIGQLRDQLQQPASGRSDDHADVLPQARQLHAALGRWIDAAARAQGAQRLVLWLDGPLRYLPLGLLHDGRQHLAQRYQLLVAGATTASSTPRGPGLPPPSAGDTLAAFGVTQALQGLPALPGVADELCDIVAGPVLGLDASTAGNTCGPGGAGRGPLAGRGRLNGHFTEASLAAAARGAVPGQLLHIGTHFVLRPGQVSKSWLLLGDGERLPMARLRSLPLGTPRLVTLSACETAVSDGGGGNGREVDGLAATLLDNGAQQVLASLWRVDDRATARFMQHFYRAYARLRGDAAAALQAAQRASLAEGAPARHWAAFVLVGQPPA